MFTEIPRDLVNVQILILNVWDKEKVLHFRHQVMLKLQASRSHSE